MGKEQQQTDPVPLKSIEALDLSGYHALLVEDNELNAEIATEILRTTGIEVTLAKDGVEAVDRMRASKEKYFDIVFMDIKMPKMNGYSAARAIRNLGREDCKQVPIIAMTANAFAEDVQEAISAGMNEHIAKPLDLEVLAAVLQRWLPK
jgi:CheY-like chemotaxis protein